MKRLNTYSLYTLGLTLRPLKNLKADMPLESCWLDAALSRAAVDVLLRDPDIGILYSRPAAIALIQALDQVLQPITDMTPEKPVDAKKPIENNAVIAVNALQTFEHNLAAELQQHDTYAVSQKGIYSTRELIEHTENLFSADVRSLMPSDAISDIRAAGQCLAFDVPTAAGFHILRGVETMMTKYIDVVGARVEKESQRNWGVYISKLKAAGADEKVVATLDQIRDLHRNPTLHPEVFLSQDEALALLGVAQSAILGIVADIKRREAGEQLKLRAPDA
jgi:hypothetical protein